MYGEPAPDFWPDAFLCETDDGWGEDKHASLFRMPSMTSFVFHRAKIGITGKKAFLRK